MDRHGKHQSRHQHREIAGATGVLYFNGKTIDNGSTFPSDIAGEICFGND